MNLNKNNIRFYAVTDRKWTGKMTLLEQIEAALAGGVTCLQLREKNMGFDDFLEEAKEVKKICIKYNVPLIINDEPSVALKSGADGIHIGQDDMEISEVRKKVGKDFIIGVSAHNKSEAVLAERGGADYLGCGAVFGSSTKSNTNPISLETVSQICSVVSIPVVAIGGINKTNILRLSGTGVDGAAIISAIFSADDIKKECIELSELTLKLVEQKSK